MNMRKHNNLIVEVVDFSLWYLRYVEPCFLVKPWYMLGDHNYYSPIQFRIVE
jgi:hypothetical protein